MTYDEYLLCAEKHLRGCISLLGSYRQNPTEDTNVWLELYYLSGYIIEGITIYSAYKLNNWTPTDDIQRKYNLNFTQQTNLDFFYVRSYKRNGVEIIPSYFQNRPQGALSVQGHRFQQIVKNLLKQNPSFNNVPYIGHGNIDSDIENLIDNWGPEVRYQYQNGLSPIPNLNYDVICRLMNTCMTIYQNHV